MMRPILMEDGISVSVVGPSFTRTEVSIWGNRVTAYQQAFSAATRASDEDGT
jgi:hypothetical protein